MHLEGGMHKKPCGPNCKRDNRFEIYQDKAVLIEQPVYVKSQFQFVK